MMKLKINRTFTQKKTQGKELEIKTIRTKLKNIVFSKL